MSSRISDTSSTGFPTEIIKDRTLNLKAKWEKGYWGDLFVFFFHPKGNNA